MVRASPTVYRGITFRSKLEADWAAYFDFCGWQWSYETEHYSLSNGATYLPDFYLEDLDTFVEVRGNLDRSLRKAALFLKESGRPILVALPEGRFFLATQEDAETGDRYSGFVEAMFAGDADYFRMFQRDISCFVELEDDAVGGIRRYFGNYGFSSPDYCGYAPDYFTCIKDRSRADGGDARAHYYGGLSTWEQRGFQRSQYLNPSWMKQ